MTTFTRERQRTEVTTWYRADDGTEFRNESDCAAYEETVKGVLGARLMCFSEKLDKDTYFSADSVLDNGNGCCHYFRCTPKTEADVQTLLAYVRSATKENVRSERTHRLSKDCTISEIVPGTTYIIALGEDDYWAAVYSEELLKAKLAEFVEDMFHSPAALRREEADKKAEADKKN